MGRFVVRAALFLIAGMISLSAGAQLVEGRDYIEISPRQPTNDPDRIVVTEFFSYQCPHCFSFFPSLANWVGSLPDDVLFERVAVSIGRQPWVPIAQAFYALQSMGELEALDTSIFRAIHTQGVRLTDEASIIDWVAQQGLNRENFARTYNSFSVKSFLARGEQLSRSHRIPSVPTLIIDGKYMVPIVDNNTFDGQLARVDQLIARARADKAAVSERSVQ